MYLLDYLALERPTNDTMTQQPQDNANGKPASEIKIIGFETRGLKTLSHL